MKKIKNNKVYDTETAKRVGEYDNGFPLNDFRYCAEELYQKKNGEFFLYGEGGPLSKYASRSGDTSGYGEQIEPLTYAQAREWAEKKLGGDEYINIFGEPEEDETKLLVSATVRKDVWQKLKQFAAQQGKTIGEIIDDLVLGAKNE